MCFVKDTILNPKIENRNPKLELDELPTRRQKPFWFHGRFRISSFEFPSDFIHGTIALKIPLPCSTLYA